MFLVIGVQHPIFTALQVSLQPCITAVFLYVGSAVVGTDCAPSWQGKIGIVITWLSRAESIHTNKEYLGVRVLDFTT